MIHPTAVIEKGARLGKGVRVGAHSYVGPGVQLADGCELRSQVTLVGRTTVGEGCVFFPGCVIGEVPQDLKYHGEETQAVIGCDNHFREHVTLHAGTALGGGVTRIGDHNRILIGVHIAHDVHIGHHVVIANHVQIAGHVHIEDCVTMGGQAGIHHFVTVGQYAMLGGLSKLTVDAPPYMIIDGHHAQVRGVNFEGLQRWRLDKADIDAIARAYKLLYAKRSQNSLSFRERLLQLQQSDGHNKHVGQLCEFVKRKLLVGNSGRYRESLRRDTPADNREFFEKKRR